MRVRNEVWLLATTLMCSAHPVLGRPLPAEGQDQHMGVASCASGVCHGAVGGRGATAVLQNEFIVWSRQDPHAGAYNALFDDDSLRIARNLGLDAAHEADICLDCHTDNVPAKHRGEKFQLSDGIGCEVCHGGAERYLDAHVASDASHARNVELGMYPIDGLETRAALCLSCHFGNEDRFVTHRLMGAGHPRLAFELDTFGALQPPHYLVDADYRERKQWAGSFHTWAFGVLSQARSVLEALESDALWSSGVFPELSLFDCHACHHAMSDRRWRSSDLRGLPPGAIRLNDAAFVMLLPLAELTGDAAQLRLALRALHMRSHESHAALQQAVRKLEGLVDHIAAGLSEIGEERADETLRNLVTLAAEGVFRDYAGAEQATMAVDVLLNATDRAEVFARELNRLYEIVDEEDAFDSGAFRRAARTVQQKL